MLVNDLVPSVHFYDQDFVDVYDRSWVWIDEYWTQGTKENNFVGNYISYPGQKTFNQSENCMASLFLVYSNQNYSPFPLIDYFYGKQEESGAIRSDYSIEDGSPVFDSENPEGVCPPLFAYVEHGFYHKIGNKKRLKEIVEPLEKHFDWLRETFRRENGLYSVPSAACMQTNVERPSMYYPITLMIEDIIGLDISLPRKTVDWTMATMEMMGIEKLSLKRNMITILSNKQARGWEVRLESEKLYYFTIEILDDKKKKTLPIPSGKCSMLIDKL